MFDIRLNICHNDIITNIQPMETQDIKLPDGNKVTAYYSVETVQDEGWIHTANGPEFDFLNTYSVHVEIDRLEYHGQVLNYDVREYIKEYLELLESGK